MEHFLYTLRWIILAIPGAILLDWTSRVLYKRGMTYKWSLYLAMLLTQAGLGFTVYYLDKKLLGGAWF